MKCLLKLMILVPVAICVFSCACKMGITTTSPAEISSVYFQKWIGGQELSGSGIDFHLKFINQLPKDTYLNKVYFQNQEAFFDRENETNFIAKFYSKSLIKNDSIIDVNKRETPDFPFNLKPTEAILEFHINNKAALVKIENIKEKELIAYPSTQPRN